MSGIHRGKAYLDAILGCFRDAGSAPSGWMLLAMPSRRPARVVSRFRRLLNSSGSSQHRLMRSVLKSWSRFTVTI